MPEEEERAVSDLRITCHCGAWQARLAAAPKSLVNCHCGFCRHLSGAACSTWALVNVADIVVERAGDLRHYEASANCTRIFCPHCGTHLRTDDKRMPGKTGVPAGVITGGDLPPIAAHYFFDHRATWSSIGDDAPRFGGPSGTEPVRGA